MPRRNYPPRSRKRKTTFDLPPISIDLIRVPREGERQRTT